jgi:anthranilate/para-aminobenzoate synthase component I
VDPLAIYAEARDAGLRPALLESLGPPTAFSRRTVLALAPSRRLEVWDGVLYEDGAEIGGAAALLDCLQTGLRPGCDFPAWIGFFSYEFAARLGLPTNAAVPGLPEAAFLLYDDGWLWRDGRLVCEPRSGPGPEVAAAAGPPRVALPRIASRSDYARTDYVAGVQEVQERIRVGWVYQVNQPEPLHGDPRRLRSRRPRLGGRLGSCAPRPRSLPSTSCSWTCCVTTFRRSANRGRSR